MIQKQIDQEAKTSLTLDMLYRVTAKERDQNMDKYFALRLADYLIQSYTRYGASGAAEADIVEAFNERNVQLEE